MKDQEAAAEEREKEAAKREAEAQAKSKEAEDAEKIAKEKQDEAEQEKNDAKHAVNVRDVFAEYSFCKVFLHDSLMPHLFSSGMFTLFTLRYIQASF